MKRIRALLVAAVGLTPAACSSPDPAAEETLQPPPSSIDEAVERRLADAGLEVLLASELELCRRLFADLVGRFPSADEIATSCAGREPGEVAAELQGRREYVVHGMRRWRDRLGTTDGSLYFRDLVPLFDDVEALLTEEIDYAEFAIRAMASPGLMALDPDAEGRAYRVHRVFLGSRATAAEASDLARLTRIWDARPGTITTFGAVLQEANRAYIVPGHCGELGLCRTDLLPGGEIAFPDPGARPFSGIKYELLTDAQRASLRGLGEFVTSQPVFWEAAADEVLDRLLGWSDGGSAPRRVGRVMPEVRQLVLEHLLETRSIASAERLVIESLLYRQSHRAADDPSRPIWAHGPLKFTSAEVLLDTVRGSSEGEGSCDPRTADDEIYRMHLLGYFLTSGDDVDTRYEAFITEFHAEQGNWRPLVLQEVEDPSDPEVVAEVLSLDRSYLDAARSFGGCPGLESPRLTPLDGLTFAFGQEVVANDVCGAESVLEWVTEDATSAEILDAMMARLLGRHAVEAERDLVDGSTCLECEFEERARGICVALLGSHEMLFY